MKNSEIKQKGRLVEQIKGLASPRRIELILIDAVIVLFTYFALRFLSSLAVGSMQVSGAFTITKMAALYVLILMMRLLAGIYNSIWRYADTLTYLKLMVADGASGVLYFLAGRYVLHDIYVGFSYTLIALMIIDLLTLASRFGYQFFYACSSRFQDNRAIRSMFGDRSTQHKINVAIVGAGNVGAALAAELLRNPKAHYNPYCFIDKDLRKVGSGINGIRVYPEDDEIVEKLKAMPVQEIIIALPDASLEDRMRLYELYKQTDCKVKLYDYPLGERQDTEGSGNGRRALREFRIEDLLFRGTMQVTSQQTKEFYRGKTVLVTGGGGSIGSELCRQIAKLEPKKLVILDIYENNAYDIEQELLRKYGSYNEKTGEGLNLETVIASVRDVKRLDEIFDAVRPQLVFHAAAHKHVPLMEHNGCEAIKNNVIGTYNVANMAEKYGVEKFLLISTDKAVNPTNIMGASKRLCEMVIQCRTDSKTEFTAVRFGNVLGSNGSVIPLFKCQIEAGGPITLTDKRIIRYFMTIPEAVGLVMETCAMAHNGELFVLDMGKPVRILDLAENMIKLSGLKPYEDIDIVEIGLRPGEKLYEELLMKTEELDKTGNKMIFIERDRGLSREEMEEKLRILRQAVLEDEAKDTSRDGHRDAVLRAIRQTVPTYHTPAEINRIAAESEEMLRAVGGDREVLQSSSDILAEVAITREN